MPDVAAVPRRSLTARTRRRRNESSFVASGSSVFELTEVAALIWRLCDGDNTVGEIVDRVVAEYDVDPELARRDTTNLLQQMAEAELVNWS